MRSRTPSRRTRGWTRAGRSSGSSSSCSRARTSTTAGSRRTCIARCSRRSRTEAQQLLEKYLDEVEASLDKREVEDPITGDSRPPDERFLRSVEEKIKISESGKMSFRQEVVRKAMVAFKAGEKFTLDNHSRLHEAIEQYLFEERRDVLRLVTSRARPDEDARAEDLRGAGAADSRVRLRRAQRERGSELRDDVACRRNSEREEMRKGGTPGRPISSSARARIASGTTCSRAARATGSATTIRCAPRSARSCPS